MYREQKKGPLAYMHSTVFELLDNKVGKQSVPAFPTWRAQVRPETPVLLFQMT